MIVMLHLFGVLAISLAWSLVGVAQEVGSSPSADVEVRTENVEPIPSVSPETESAQFEPQAPVIDESGAIAAAITVEDIVEPPADYQYAAFGRPDPFLPPIRAITASLEVPIVSILQNYPTSELSVVGIWQTDSGERKALILTPKQEGVVAAVGDSLGRLGGRVSKISDSDVTVREFSLSPDGTRKFDDVKLNLGPLVPPPETVLNISLPPKVYSPESDTVSAVGDGKGLGTAAIPYLKDPVAIPTVPESGTVAEALPAEPAAPVAPTASELTDSPAAAEENAVSKDETQGQPPMSGEPAPVSVEEAQTSATQMTDGAVQSEQGE